MLKLDFLKRLGFLAFTAPLAALQRPTQAEAADTADPIVGLWEANVKAGDVKYQYVYSISRGAYVATGNVDENFMGFKYSPSMGTYVRIGNGSYRYRERGYVFDLTGHNVGSFTSIGTFKLSADGNTMSGPGTFTQYDVKAKKNSSESYAVTATRISP